MSANEYVVINGKRYAAIAGVGTTDSSGGPAGSVVAHIATLSAGENQNLDKLESIDMFDLMHLAASGTHDLSQNPGAYLHSITINGGTAGAVTVYNDTTGGTTSPVAVIAAAAAATPAGTKTYDVALTNGLQIVLAANTDITVSYLPSILD